MQYVFQLSTIGCWIYAHLYFIQSLVHTKQFKTRNPMLVCYSMYAIAIVECIWNDVVYGKTTIEWFLCKKRHSCTQFDYLMIADGGWRMESIQLFDLFDFGKIETDEEGNGMNRMITLGTNVWCLCTEYGVRILHIWRIKKDMVFIHKAIYSTIYKVQSSQKISEHRHVKESFGWLRWIPNQVIEYAYIHIDRHWHTTDMHSLICKRCEGCFSIFLLFINPMPGKFFCDFLSINRWLYSRLSIFFPIFRYSRFLLNYSFTKKNVCLVLHLAYDW